MIQFLKDLNDFETIIAIALALLLPIFGVFLKKFFPNYGKTEVKISPSMTLNKRKHGRYYQLELYNNGNEALVGLKAEIDGMERKSFINFGEDQTWATPHYCEMLDEKERKLMIDIPKKATVKISAKGAKSQELLEVEEAYDFPDQIG